ncbi:uncharacterized protein K444DRAFT_620384 [Hyaloscypha bicolor E]|uniref:Fungal N-terminal domain-containing protein n=1 Tax=Hyaloscypha bicolor E TaxID=1095630 RepID=A0A2J6SKE6_9HELO|nr:uncharacterized protein K444DRAFT_620384 [Hyaloscypha bicolor E]PMD51242.1 hypothetical protein K444DRAFT_620384 [Hyaloscypha bicolor E]
MAEVLGTASAVVQLLEAAISVMGRLRRAFERQKEMAAVLEKHDLELNNLISLVRTIEDEKDLRTDAVSKELKKLGDIERELVDCLNGIDPGTKGKVHQIAHQLFHGSKEERKLANIMNDLTRAKLDLSFRVQVASVGVIRDVGDAVLVNAETINRIDRCLRELLGEGKGLRIAKLLRDGCPQDQDGNFRLKRADVDEALEYDDGNKRSGNGPGHYVREKVRKIDNNKAEKNSLVVAAPVVTDIWAHMDRIEINGNSALDGGAVIGYPMGVEGLEFTKYLLDRQERIADKERQATKEEREAERGSMTPKG